MMQLESHEVAEIIDSKRRKLILAATAAAMEGGTEADTKGAAEFTKIINEFTGEIARAIQEAEDERVGATLDDMAKEAGE